MVSVAACGQNQEKQSASQHRVSNVIQSDKATNDPNITEIGTQLSSSTTSIQSDNQANNNQEKHGNSVAATTNISEPVNDSVTPNILQQADNVNNKTAPETNIPEATKPASPIATTEFAKPDENSEITTVSANQQFLTELIEKHPEIDYAKQILTAEQQSEISAFCQKIDQRLSSVSYAGCIAAKHKLSPFKSVLGEPIVVTEFAPKSSREPLGRVLVISGTHGDELTSVSTAYKWIEKLNKYHSGLFHWHVAPVINPDGLFPRPATRTNANGVDINRNLPTPDWAKQSVLRWQKLDNNPRKNPGIEAASEPETLWIMHAIETFKPDAIISIHAPYGVLDFDSPKLNLAPRKFGRLKLNLLGTYPGSLGNYAGIEKGVPVLTLELPNAQYMPPKQEIDAIWSDMIDWLRDRLEKPTS